jgi:type IV pilus assembly protein PilM
MFGGSKQKALVGLDIGSSSIKAVELKSSKHGYELVSFGLEALAQDTVVDGAIMDAPLVAGAISTPTRSKLKMWPPRFLGTR